MLLLLTPVQLNCFGGEHGVMVDYLWEKYLLTESCNTVKAFQHFCERACELKSDVHLI